MYSGFRKAHICRTSRARGRPSSPAAAAPYRKPLETPYWDLVRNCMSAADLDYLPSTAIRVSRNPGSQAERRRDGVQMYAKIGALTMPNRAGRFAQQRRLKRDGKTTTSITLEKRHRPVS